MRPGSTRCWTPRRALAGAEAQAGVIPAAAAEAIAARAAPSVFDAAALFEAGRAAREPSRAARPQSCETPSAASQRSTSTGARRARTLSTPPRCSLPRAPSILLLGVLDGIADSCASLADAHRSTPMAGRTLLQQAVPITFGLKAAGWLVAVREARSVLARVRAERLAVQLGGAAGTLAPLGDRARK